MGDVSGEPKRRGRPRKNPLPEGVRNGSENIISGDRLAEPSESGDLRRPGDSESDRPGLTASQARALDRDHDGEPGGSLPKANLEPRELEGMVAEFFYAYEMQEEIKRGDRFNRIWSFRHQPVKNHDHMRVAVKRGPIEAERLLITSHLPRDMVESVILELDAETSR